MGIVTNWKTADLVDPYEMLAQMQNQADDYEANVVRDVAIRTGYYWRCKCGWVNTSDKTTCQGKIIEGGKKHSRRSKRPCLP